VTISVTKDDGSTPTSPSGNDFGLASANDKGPVNIITEDPSCAAWRPINDTFAAITKNGWTNRDPSIPAANWTPEQRSNYDEVGRAARNAADQTVALAKLTPHRVIRELYEQFIAYARAYSNAIPHYVPVDDHLARVVNSSSSALVYACAAIEYGSAEARSPLLSAPAPPSTFATLADSSDPQKFISSPEPICADWVQLLNQFDEDTKAWQTLDSAISASSWNADQRSVVESVIPVMKRLADDIERLGRSSANPVVQDFAVFAAQYRRAYADALPTYAAADSYLSSTAAGTTSTTWEACKASEG